MRIDKFFSLHGQAVMYCQIIENDIKLIYAAMVNDDIGNTLEAIGKKKWTLGKTLAELKKLDLSDGNPYIAEEDYDFLKQITAKRNHWCHQTYINFLYLDNFEQSMEYKHECSKLIKDNKKLSSVYQSIEKTRIQAMQDFNKL